MSKLNAVDEALGAWVAEISDPAYEAPDMLIDFVKTEADGRLRNLLLEHLKVPKTQPTWPTRKIK